MNDRWLTLHPVLSPVLSLGIIFVLTIAFFWLEWNRNTPYRLLRFACLALLLISVAGLVFRPAFKTERSTSVALLTAGYEPRKIDSLQHQHAGLTLIHAPGAKAYKNSSAVNSWHELSYDHAIDFVIGEGLPPGVADLLPGSFQFIPCRYPIGVVAVNAKPRVPSKRTSVISGVYNTADTTTTLYLEGPGGKEDSITFPEKGLRSFKLRFTTKASGNFLYTLRARDQVIGRFPIQVEEHRPANILFIQHYPTFESRYLKELLGEAHAVTFRYKLSKHTFRYEFINRKPKNVERLSVESLSDFDLLILDTDALQSLSPAESNALRQSIRSGLGMVVLFNESPLQVKSLKTFLPVTFRPTPSDTAKLSLTTTNVTLPSWPLAVVAEEGSHLVPVLRNKNRILSGYHQEGFGKTGFQLLQETYRLFLKGDSMAYSAVWSGLLEATMRSQRATFNTRILTPFPVRIDEQVSVEVVSSGAIPEAMKENVRVPLIEDSRIDDRWTGHLWVDKPGWHAIKFPNDSAHIDFYCPEKNEWTSLTSANNIHSTQQIASRSLTRKQMLRFDEPLPRWIFYGLFLICAGFLWLAPKLS